MWRLTKKAPIRWFDLLVVTDHRDHIGLFEFLKYPCGLHVVLCWRHGGDREFVLRVVWRIVDGRDFDVDAFFGVRLGALQRRSHC